MDSNHLRLDLQSNALPIELLSHKKASFPLLLYIPFSKYKPANRNVNGYGDDSGIWTRDLLADNQIF